jgi:hypothetical protein
VRDWRGLVLGVGHNGPEGSSGNPQKKRNDMLAPLSPPLSAGFRKESLAQTFALRPCAGCHVCLQTPSGTSPATARHTPQLVPETGQSEGVHRHCSRTCEHNGTGSTEKRIGVPGLRNTGRRRAPAAPALVA